MDTQEARIFTALIIAVLVIGVIIFYFALSIIRQQKKNFELQNAMTLVELSTMEKERARIANDLHDELSPVLSVVKFQIGSVKVSDWEEKEQLKKASKYLDEMLQLVRGISNDLMPSTLIRKGLAAALEEFTARVAESGQLKISLSYPEEITLPEEVSVNIYRALQEVIHNTLKHAKADHMEISLHLKKSQLSILCKDNGIGFEPAAAGKKSKGLGLSSLRNRTSIMGGRITIESRPGHGTAVLFKIPVN